MLAPSKSNTFTPKLFTLLRSGYTLSDLKSDLIAGLIVAIIALPLAMALAIASGASPDKGLITAVIAGFFISFLGGSRVQIGGPTGAFVLIVFNVIAQHGYDGLLMATMLAGIILIIAGYAKLGQIIKWIPHPVIAGFTAGIALIIVSSQVKDFFGFQISQIPADFIDKWSLYFSSWHTIETTTTIMGLLALSSILVMRKYAPKLPSYFITICICSFIAFLFQLPIETIGQKFPDLTTQKTIFVFSFPEFSIAKFKEIIPSAFIIAFLAGIEALLSAVVADGMTGFKHRPNQELIAQGIANIASSAIGGLPATGAIARTATNIKSGAKTPMAGIFHALFLLLFILYFMNIIAFIPLTVLAAILFIVAWNMSDIHYFVHILRLSASERIVLLLTFFLTIFVDLTLAIGAGVTLASILFTTNLAKTVEIYNQKSKLDDNNIQDDEQRVDLPQDVEVFQINGPIFFGVANDLLDALQTIGQPPKIIVLRMRLVPYLDISGKNALKNTIKKCLDKNIKVILSATQKQPLDILLRAKIQDDNKMIYFRPSYKSAIQLAKEITQNG